METILRLEWLRNPGLTERLVSGECEFKVRCQDPLIEIDRASACGFFF